MRRIRIPWLMCVVLASSCYLTTGCAKSLSAPRGWGFGGGRATAWTANGQAAPSGAPVATSRTPPQAVQNAGYSPPAYYPKPRPASNCGSG